MNPDNHHLTALRGVQHALHLLRTGRAHEARQVTDFNREYMQNYYPENLSLCYSLLGDLEALASRPDNAEANYDQAVKIAREIAVGMS